MKIYRVVKEPFFSSHKLYLDEINGVESIYYDCGIASFIKEKDTHINSTIWPKIEHYKVGKYFFLFLEDAYLEGQTLTNSPIFRILVYDVPLDKILDNIGYNKDNKNKYIQTNISIDDLCFFERHLNTIDEDVILDIVYKSFKQSIEDLQNADRTFDIMFPHSILMNNIPEEFLRDTDLLKSLIKDFGIVQAFKEKDRLLVQSRYNKKKNIYVDKDYLTSNIVDTARIEEYFLNNGLQINFAIEKTDFKNDIIECIDYNEKYKIKTLLSDNFYR